MNRCPDNSKAKSLACLAGALAVLVLAGCGNRDEDRAPRTPSTEVMAVDTPKPAYPMELACAGVGGQVVLNITVGPEGKASNVRLVTTSGNDALDQLAIEGVKDWVFRPATRNGQPQSQAIQVPVNFKVPQVRPDECFALDASS